MVKSTVPVGTNDRVEQFIKDFLVRKELHIEVASNPEFLAQGSAVHDTLHAARIIIGTESVQAEENTEKNLRALSAADRGDEPSVSGDDKVCLQRFSGTEDFLYE